VRKSLFCGHAGIGRQARLRGVWALPVRVQVSLAAPNVTILKFFWDLSKIKIPLRLS